MYSRISRSVAFINVIAQIILSQTYRYQVGDVKFCATSKFAVSLSGDHKDSTDRVATLKTEAVLTCVHGTWAGLVQLHALSSVLKCTIFSVYPNASHAIRPLFHGFIHPRVVNNIGNQNDPLYIMWTRDSNFDNRSGAMFQPNHFVPLLSRAHGVHSDDDFPPLTSLASNSAPKSFETKPRDKCFSNFGKRKRTKVGSKFGKKSVLSPREKQTTLHKSTTLNARFEAPLDNLSPHISKSNINEKCNKQKSEDTSKVRNSTTKSFSAVNVLPLPLLSRDWYGRQVSSEGKTSCSVHHHSSMPKRFFLPKNSDSKSSSSVPNQVLAPDHRNNSERKMTTTTVKSDNFIPTPLPIKMHSKNPTDILPFINLSPNWYKNQAKHFNAALMIPVTQMKCNTGKPSGVNAERDMLIDILQFKNLSCNWYEGQLKKPYLMKSETIQKDSNIVPLKLSQSWYRRRGRLAKKNASRKECTTAKSSGTLAQNIKDLKDHCSKKNAVGNKKKLQMINVGEYILRNGPFVPTQQIGHLLRQTSSNQGESMSKRRKMSSEILKTLQSHLNVVQIYIKGTGYLLENRYYDPTEVALRLEKMISNASLQELNKQVHRNVGDVLETAVRFADTKKDRDLIKGLFARTTSIKQTAKMLNVKNRASIRNAEHQLNYKIQKFECLERESQIVRNDLTNEQQRRLTKRIIACKKQKLFKLQSETRGRALIADLFPELKIVLEEIFNYGSGEMVGGLESHPRLTTDIMYRSRDNNLFMRQARDILLKVCPPGLGISLSSCYNYTKSYKEKTHAAKRHHAGKNINARISLQCPPRTNVIKHVVNLHWTTKNVNLIQESTNECKPDCVVDSKDAKTIICGDIQPVQNPGKSWKQISYPDHTFDQSRTNAVYPMTHLFLDDVRSSSFKDGENVVEITRTGCPVSLINIAISEPETTFRAMNEFLYLLTQPSLDSVFRNSKTGRLKSIFVFLVDNGHGEDPDSPLIQMCLARILSLLNLSKISQRSFAEYHSKRNFVERVHASENLALSRHGAFNSKQIHPKAEVGSAQHLENMEKMADDVKDCLAQARFAGRFLQCFRGIGRDGIFNDEERLKEFLRFSEERKEECDWTYGIENVKNPHFQAIVDVWGVPETFERHYTEDYILISGNKNDADRTCWNDKYSTNIYGKDNRNNLELQPIPDFVSWQQSGELRYLSYEKTSRLYESLLIKTPELFLPSIILDNLFVINNTPPDDILSVIAILTWLPLDDVNRFFQNKNEKEEKEYQQHLSRETWRNHPLYKKKLTELQQICKTSGLPTKGNKHELVKSLAVRNEENEPSRFQPHYDGDIKSLPSNMSDIKKLPIATLKYILKSHSISICGNKDELMLRVFLLKHGRPYLAAFNQVKAVKNTIQIAKAIISEEVKTYFLETDNVRRVRKHSVMLKNRSSLPVPEWIKCPSDLHNIFEPLERYINNGIDKSNTACLSVPLSVENCVNFNDAEDESTYDAYYNNNNNNNEFIQNPQSGYSSEYFPYNDLQRTIQDLYNMQSIQLQLIYN